MPQPTVHRVPNISLVHHTKRFILSLGTKITERFPGRKNKYQVATQVTNFIVVATVRLTDHYQIKAVNLSYIIWLYFVFWTVHFQ